MLESNILSTVRAKYSYVDHDIIQLYSTLNALTPHCIGIVHSAVDKDLLYVLNYISIIIIIFIQGTLQVWLWTKRETRVYKKQQV